MSLDEILKEITEEDLKPKYPELKEGKYTVVIAGIERKLSKTNGFDNLIFKYQILESQEHPDLKNIIFNYFILISKPGDSDKKLTLTKALQKLTQFEIPKPKSMENIVSYCANYVRGKKFILSVKDVELKSGKLYKVQNFKLIK